MPSPYLRATGTVRISGPSSVTAMVCSKWADRLPSAVTHRPAVVEQRRARRSRVHHRLDGEALPARSVGGPCPACPSSGRRAPRASPCRCRGRRTPAPPRTRPASATRLDGVADVGEAAAGDHGLDAGAQRRLGDLEQPLRLVGDLPDAGGEGGVAVVALDDRPAVDGDDVALVEPVRAGDAVDDHVVRRGADHGRERRVAVAEEVRPGAAAVEHVAADPVERRRW